MVTTDAAALALVAATWLHLGFQLVVTLLVYPGFDDVRRDDWPAVHVSHTRRIGPIVALVYGALLVAGGVVLAVGPSPGQVVAVAAIGVAMATTAVVAGPAHGRLSPDRPPGLLARLVAADRVRLVAAAVAAVAALVGSGLGG